jgi:hypothetical protein
MLEVSNKEDVALTDHGCRALYHTANEPPTRKKAMMLIGFAWLGLTGWRAQQKVGTAHA